MGVAGSTPHVGRFGLIVGAMKCGTTSLFRLLAQHPQIAACRIKEPRFFNWDERYRRGRAWYEDLFEIDPDRHRVAIEASTGYSRTVTFPATIGRIQAYPAEFRFLLLVRDPIERMESHYRHAQSNAYGDGILRHDGLHPEVLEASNYMQHIDCFVEAFGKEAVWVQSLESLRAAPQETLASAQSFLDVAPYEHNLSASGANASSDRRQVRPRVRRVSRILGRGATERLAPLTRRGPLHKLLFRDEPPRFTMPDTWREEAMEALAPGMRRLQQEHGIAVARWGFR